MSSIKFLCECGQHLNARPDSAGRLTMCPRCRAPVVVPQLTANHRGVDRPSTSLVGSQRERKLSNPSSATPAPSSTMPATETRLSPQCDAPELPRKPPRTDRRRKSRRRSKSEAGTVRLRSQPRWMRLCEPTSWGGRVNLLDFSLGSFPAVVGASVGLAATGIISLRILPDVLAADRNAVLQLVVLLIIAGMSAAYACLFLTRTLKSTLPARATGAEPVGLDPVVALKSLGLWAACMIIGPLPLVAGGMMYWLHCGDMKMADYAVLAELALIAVAYALFAVTVVCKTGRLRDLNPVRVVDEAVACGARGLAAWLLTCILVAFHAALAYQAATTFRNDAFLAFSLLALCWLSALYLGSLVLRLVGRCNHERMSPSSIT